MDTFRVLILVLASDTDPIYRAFESAWRSASHPRVDIVFYKAHPNVKTDFIDGDTMFVGCEETLDAVYEKQMRAFRLLAPRLSRYAYVFRTNLSSFVNIPLYLQFCAGLPRTGVYSGVVGEHEGIRFASGSGFTITPDLIERLVRENPPGVFLDDVSIGSAIASWGVPILPAPRVDHSMDGMSLGMIPSPTSQLPFHHRVKTNDRARDARVVRELFARAQ